MKQTKSSLKKSLLNDLTLMIKEDKYSWATFSEIKDYMENGHVIFNDEKRELYSKIGEKECKKKF